MKPGTQVVITGTGLACSLGKDTAETWKALLSGQTGIKPVAGFDTSGFGPCAAAQVEGLTADSLGVHPRDARIMDLHSFLFLMASREAFRKAHPVHSGMLGEEMGMFAGMGMIDYKIDDLMPAVLKSLAPDGSIDYHAFYARGYQEIHPLWPLSILDNITFCQVAIDLGIRGENSVFCPHAEGGMMAVTEGFRNVLEGRSRLVLSGGVSEKVSPLSIARGLLSGVLKKPSGNVGGLRPFGEEDKGTALGEGAGIIALELRSSADSRGVPYSVMITGYGHACERRDDGPAPTARAVSLAMSQALETASLRKEDIDLVIAHGDATLHGDRSEKEALIQVFSGRSDLPVFSSKPALGHLLAAAPAVDIILGMLIIENGIIPPAVPIGAEDAGRGGINLVSGSPLVKNIRKIMINCQSYEGQCSSVILESVA